MDRRPTSHRLSIRSLALSNVNHEALASLSKSKWPKDNRSYNTLVEHHQYLLIHAKSHFFPFIRGILKIYLVIFQNDSPLLPFMFDEVSLILYHFVRWVYKKKKVDDVINLRKLMNNEFSTNQSNQLEEYLNDLGAAMNCAIKNSTLLLKRKKRRFLEACKQILKSFWNAFQPIEW